MKKREKTNKSTGFNKAELEQAYPEIANAFSLIIAKFKSQDEKVNALAKKYHGRYLNQYGNVRKIPLSVILQTLERYGLTVTYSVQENGKAIEKDEYLRHSTPHEVLAAYLNKQQTGLKQYSWGGRRYRNAVYLYEECFYSCVKEGDDWPKPDMKGAVPIEWERMETIFDRYGFQVLKCKAELKYFPKIKQVIRYQDDDPND